MMDIFNIVATPNQKIHIKVFTRWVNYKLYKWKGGPVKDVFEDNILFSFVEQIFGDTIEIKGRNKIQNYSMLIDYFKSKNILNVHVEPHELIEHDPTACETLLWSIIQHTTIETVKEYGKSGKIALISWGKQFISKYPGYNIDNFKQLQESTNLCALVHALNPGTFELASINKKPPDEIYSFIFRNIQENYNIAPLLDVQDVTNERAMLVYVATIYHASKEIIPIDLTLSLTKIPQLPPRPDQDKPFEMELLSPQSRNERTISIGNVPVAQDGPSWSPISPNTRDTNRQLTTNRNPKLSNVPDDTPKQLTVAKAITSSRKVSLGGRRTQSDEDRSLSISPSTQRTLQSSKSTNGSNTIDICIEDTTKKTDIERLEKLVTKFEDTIIEFQEFYLRQNEIIPLCKQFTKLRKNTKTLNRLKESMKNYESSVTNELMERYNQVIKYWDIMLSLYQTRLGLETLDLDLRSTSLCFPIPPLAVEKIDISTETIHKVTIVELKKCDLKKMKDPTRKWIIDDLVEEDQISSDPQRKNTSTTTQKNPQKKPSKLSPINRTNSHGKPIPNISLKILETKIEKDKKKRLISVYHISVTEGDMTWNVKRQQSQIIELQEQLLKQFGSMDDSSGIVPGLSGIPKSLSSSSSIPGKYDKQISAWLSKLSEDQKICNSPIFRDFFKDKDRTFHEGYLHRLSERVDGTESVFWKKVKWHMVRNGVITKYKNKTDKYPYGAKILIKRPGGFIEVGSKEHDQIKQAQLFHPIEVFPFYVLPEGHRKTKDKKIFYAALSDHERQSWLAAISANFGNIDDEPETDEKVSITNKL